MGGYVTVESSINKGSSFNIHSISKNINHF
jgi:hypothetical protein